MKASIPLLTTFVTEEVTGSSQKRHEATYSIVKDMFQMISVVYHELFLASLEI